MHLTQEEEGILAGEAGEGRQWAMQLLVGLGSAFLSGFAAIFFLLRTLQKRGFDRFAWYCWLLAALGLILL